ncbi:unnamed protein product [Protopolystoma xenopodis]|uniref:Uncharacterized protein n=1 Tax=Protopolystoma xenopodis TaxID=117903 RepID=A0A3S5CGK6_9PLAT|nr:unnamed protein product [Protopolystoma xenopodis]
MYRRQNKKGTHGRWASAFQTNQSFGCRAASVRFRSAPLPTIRALSYLPLADSPDEAGSSDLRKSTRSPAVLLHFTDITKSPYDFGFGRLNLAMAFSDDFHDRRRMLDGHSDQVDATSVTDGQLLEMVARCGKQPVEAENNIATHRMLNKGGGDIQEQATSEADGLRVGGCAVCCATLKSSLEVYAKKVSRGVVRRKKFFADSGDRLNTKLNRCLSTMDLIAYGIGKASSGESVRKCTAEVKLFVLKMHN